MTTKNFTIAVYDISNCDYPIYKATCISGYGSGIGRSRESAIENCKTNLRTMVSICNEINLPLELITKTEFLSEPKSPEFIYSFWNHPSCEWMEIDYQDLMK